MSKRKAQEDFVNFLNLFYDSEKKYYVEPKKFMTDTLPVFVKNKKPKLKLFKQLKFVVISFAVVIFTFLILSIKMPKNIVDNSYNDFVIDEFLQTKPIKQISVIDKIINTTDTYGQYYSFFESEYINESHDFYLCMEKDNYNYLLELYKSVSSDIRLIKCIEKNFDKSFDVIDGKVLYLLNLFKDRFGVEDISQLITTMTNNVSKDEKNPLVCIYSFRVINFKVTKNLETGKCYNIKKQAFFTNTISNDANIVKQKNEKLNLYTYFSQNKLKQLTAFSEKSLYENKIYIYNKILTDNFDICAFLLDKKADNNIVSILGLNPISNDYYYNLLFNSYNSIFGKLNLIMKNHIIGETKIGKVYKICFNNDVFFELCKRNIFV